MGRHAEREVAGHRAGAIGLGAGKFSLGRERPPDSESIGVIHAALDGGARLIDTARVYCGGEGDVGHNERLVARALQTWGGDGDDVLVVAKAGQWWDGDVPQFDGGAAFLRAECEAILTDLHIESLGLYVLHRLPRDYRPDEATRLESFAESIDTLGALQREGKVRAIGLSNVDARMLDDAALAAPLAAVENPIGVHRPLAESERAACERHDLAFLGWGALSGTLGSASRVESTRLAALRDIASDRHVSIQQITLAWELSQSSRLLPLVGASRVETILDSLEAQELELSAEELALLGA